MVDRILRVFMIMKITMENSTFDWKQVVSLLQASRKIDAIEENELTPQKKVLYQFSAGGHDMAQILLGSLLTNPRDSAGGYYRSRPLCLTLGLNLVDAIAAPMGKSGAYSDGRDIGVVCNLPTKNGPIVLPASGDVGSQYTPSVGYAQAITYRRDILKDKSYEGAIAVTLGGEASVATNGFWSALTIATTLKLPVFFYIEDNGYGISVTSDKQTPGSNIAENLASFKNLKIMDGEGSDPLQAGNLLSESINHVRSGEGPALLRLRVPRLSGHSGQDTQAYKPEDLLREERARDPLQKLREYLIPEKLTEKEWDDIESQAENSVRMALGEALSRSEPDPSTIHKYVFSELQENGDIDLQVKGGLLAEGHKFPSPSEKANPEPTRINMLTAIRRTLEFELKTNPKVLVFGEDVGPKGGVHAATLGLQDAFGAERVFDTSLSEEGIIGRAVGMAVNGLMPVAEIQFRKYADPATEQLNNCGTMRWRTANRFAAPIVVRMPGGFGARCGDPWHSVCNEVMFAHAIGWQVAFPSNAEDAVGLLRQAMRSNNPTIFFEHRASLDSAWARRPYPGDEFIVPFGKAKLTMSGDDISIVTWGAMVERVEAAVNQGSFSADVIDLRSIAPWDRESVLQSVRKTRRCLIVHEDTRTAGFGAEISATIVENEFLSLDAPVQRLTMPDVPSPYNTGLMNEILPGVEKIIKEIEELIGF